MQYVFAFDLCPTIKLQFWTSEGKSWGSPVLDSQPATVNTFEIQTVEEQMFFKCINGKG